MLYVIYEDNFYNITNVISQVKEKYPNSSTLYLYKDNTEYIINEVKDRPLLTDGWLIITSELLTSYVIDKLNTKDNDVIISVNSRNKFESIIDRYNSKLIEFKFLDSTKSDKKSLVAYARKELNTSFAIADRLCSLCRYNSRLVVDNIMLLKGVDNINLDNISRYVETQSSVNIQTVLLAILGYRGTYKFNYKACIKFLHNYRYAYKYLTRYFKKELLSVIEIYEQVDMGNLSLENYKDFRKIKTNHIKTYIKLRDQVSFEYIYYVYEVISNLTGKKTDILVFINLLRLNK